MSESQDEKVTRRDFMKVAIVGMGGVIAAAVGLPAIAYVVGPASKQDANTWIRLGAISKVEMNNPTLFKASVDTQTGWINTQEEVSAYVLTENGQDFVAMSNVCTHLGCRIRWIAEMEGFYCPCHNGVFGKDGSVKSGPPPRALDHFETKVENGILFIKRE
ncbi:MAG: ubiquinol-cytochrome c reductase iron-sulfur subunit [Chloroflexi bacterium]|nr:ubiquinol-cytochrome c reductase iron-sulfur subunit [Chloroflexota bacterium]